MTQFDKQLFWELLIACQRTKSLARASAQLRLSLSSASKLIAAFETQTQLQLLDRTTRPATLTRNFERLVPIAQKLVKANVEAQRIIQTLKSEAKGETVHGRIIRICLPINVRNDAILERLLDCASASPGLRLEFFGDEGYERLLAGDVDIAQFGFFPNNQTLRADFIRTNGFLMLASHSFVARYGLPQDITELERFTIAIRNPENRSFSRRLQHGEETYFVPDSDRIIYADTTTCRSLLLLGRAISIDVSISTVLPEIKTGKLVAVLPGWHRKPNDTYVCCHMKHNNDPVINDLMAIIRETLRDEESDRWTTWLTHFGVNPETVKAAL